MAVLTKIYLNVAPQRGVTARQVSHRSDELSLPRSVPYYEVPAPQAYSPAASTSTSKSSRPPLPEGRCRVFNMKKHHLCHERANTTMFPNHSATPAGAPEDGHGRDGTLFPSGEGYFRRRDEVEARLDRNEGCVNATQSASH